MIYKIKANNDDIAGINDMIDWCCQNCRKEFYINAEGVNNYFNFESEEDALLFKLSW